MILNRVLAMLNRLQLFGHGTKPCVVVLDGKRYTVTDAVPNAHEVQVTIVAE